MALIYLDYNATTPIDRIVADAMLPFLYDHYGNPSSSHALGQTTKAAVEKARKQVASLIGASPEEIVFTSGGTESNNLVLKGLFSPLSPKPSHLILSSIEHPAITEPSLILQREGVSVTFLPVDPQGRVAPAHVEAAIRPDTRLISVMLANNEVGTLQPLREIAAIARNHRVLLHTDAAQAIGKIPVDVHDLGIDFLSIAGHKLYAPKGVGALYIRQGVTLPKVMHGASHEKDRRAGTENVLGIVGLGEAAALAEEEIAHEGPRLAALREELWDGLLAALPSRVIRHSPREGCLPNTLNIGLLDLPSSAIMPRLQEKVAVSAGSACHSHGSSLSPVLHAMGISPRSALGALRFSLGRFSTSSDLHHAISLLTRIVHDLSSSPQAQG